MKKKIFLVACAWLLCLGHVFADKFVINDITIPQGGTADLAVGFYFTSTTSKVGFTFALGLPEGISLVKDADGDPVYNKDETSIAKLDIKTAGEGSFAGLPSNENATIKGTSGTLLILHLRSDASLAIGSTHVVNVTKATFQQKVEGSTTDINIPDFTFTIAITKPTDGRTVLDENSTSAPAAANGVDVRVLRTIKADEWSTICLPFTATGEQVKTAFGEDVQLATFTAWESEEDNDGAIVGINVTFTSANAEDGIEANTPMLIKVSEVVTEATFDGVTLEPEEEPVVQVGKRASERGWFYGTYVVKQVPEENLFLSGNKFWYSTGATTIKGYRGYFEFRDVLDAYYDGTEVKINFFLDDEETGISEIENGKLKDESSIYNLAGQRINKMQKGVNIVNGRKVLF